MSHVRQNRRCRQWRGMSVLPREQTSVVCPLRSVLCPVGHIALFCVCAGAAATRPGLITPWRARSTAGRRSPSNEWAPVQSSIAGPYIFVLSEGFLVAHQMFSEPTSAWPSRSDPADRCGFLDSAKRASSCCSPNLRRDLAVEQGRWLEPVASCSSPRVGRRTSVRIRCVLFDHMIKRRYPRRGEQNAPLPRQVQHPKCCGRYHRLSSNAVRNPPGFPV